MNFHELYFQNKLSLSAFGIERGENRSDYVCTPKGAKIIGWTGIDGVHYCMVKVLGEIVFAVEPLATPGRHVFPVAKNFEDFLRLLMACGHEAYLEQAHAWTEEQYLAFAENNPIRPDAAETIRHLQTAYGLTPIDDPYHYLTALYDGFDFSKVPYKKDYYEFIPREEMPIGKNWQVYFSLHDRKDAERAGEEFPLNARFSWAGYDLYIPCAYLCAKGLVLDVFARADRKKVHEFLSQWIFAENCETELTAEQRNRIERENPLNLDFDSAVEVNGKFLAERQGMGNVWVQEYEMYCSEATRDVLTHYGLSLDQCWIWKRISFPWATKTKPSVKSLSLKLVQEPKATEGERFTVEREGQEIAFTHPVTGIRHTLTVKEYVRDQLNQLHTISDGFEHPACCTKMTYTVEPSLPNTGFSITDTRPSDLPRKTDKIPKNSDFAGAIAIIGGADGPTAVIMGEPEIISVKNLRAACSALTFEPQEKVEWKMTFRVKTAEDFHIRLK